MAHRNLASAELLAMNHFHFKSLSVSEAERRRFMTRVEGDNNKVDMASNSHGRGQKTVCRACNQL